MEKQPNNRPLEKLVSLKILAAICVLTDAIREDAPLSNNTRDVLLLVRAYRELLDY